MDLRLMMLTCFRDKQSECLSGYAPLYIRSPSYSRSLMNVDSRSPGRNEWIPNRRCITLIHWHTWWLWSSSILHVCSYRSRLCRSRICPGGANPVETSVQFVGRLSLARKHNKTRCIMSTLTVVQSGRCYPLPSVLIWYVNASLLVYVIIWSQSLTRLDSHFTDFTGLYPVCNVPSYGPRYFTP